MSSSLIVRSLVLLFIGWLGHAVAVPKAFADLDEAAMSTAIDYFGELRGKELSSEERAWLKQQWQDEAELSPKATAAQVDDLAFALESLRQDPDPLALANGRTNILKSTYCSAKQSSDPTTHRLSDILAPDDIILAADCILGLVITDFDVDAAVASHALIAEVTGQAHDAKRDRAEIIRIIEDGFADATPAEKALVAHAELRHATLAHFWSRIDGLPEQAAVVGELRKTASSDLKAPARQLESLAMSKLGGVDYLARVGDAKITAGAMAIYEEWLGRIAGYTFSHRVQGWLHRTIIKDFKNDPQRVLNEVAHLKKLNRDYVLSDTAEEKASLIASWAAGLYCHLRSSEDPDEQRLQEIVFRENPTIAADCSSNSILRKSQSVLVEASGQKLLEQDLDVSMRFAAMILGRPLLPTEEAVIREDNIQTFKNDPEAWQLEKQQTQDHLAKVGKYDDSHFLAMDERKTLFDRVYCALQVSDDAYADDYLAMFKTGNTVLFEDCDQNLVTTEEEIQAAVGVANFLALLNEEPPLGEAEIKEIRGTFKSHYMGKAESSMLALQEWWSLLSLDEKAAEAAKVRARNITIESDAQTIANYLDLVRLQVVTRNATRKSCEMAAIVMRGQTAIYGASLGPGSVTPNNPSGIPVGQLAGLVSSNNLFSELCKNVPGG